MYVFYMASTLFQRMKTTHRTISSWVPSCFAKSNVYHSLVASFPLPPKCEVELRSRFSHVIGRAPAATIFLLRFYWSWESWTVRAELICPASCCWPSWTRSRVKSEESHLRMYSSMHRVRSLHYRKPVVNSKTRSSMEMPRLKSVA